MGVSDEVCTSSSVATRLDGVVAAVDEDAKDDLGLPVLADTELPQLLAGWRARRR